MLRTAKVKPCLKIQLSSYLFSVLSFEDEVWADRQHVHACAFEAIDRFGRSADDRLILVEAGIQNDGNSRPALEGPYQIVVQRVFLAADGLQPPVSSTWLTAQSWARFSGRIL